MLERGGGMRAVLEHDPEPSDRPRRMISRSKSNYLRRHPDHVVVFNANLCLAAGKVSWVDLDLTLEPRLVELARRIGRRVFVLYERDGRFHPRRSRRSSGPSPRCRRTAGQARPPVRGTSKGRHGPGAPAQKDASDSDRRGDGVSHSEPATLGQNGRR
jgi:hypothetical protein